MDGSLYDKIREEIPAYLAVFYLPCLILIAFLATNLRTGQRFRLSSE